jgi:predicted metal-binding protein
MLIIKSCKTCRWAGCRNYGKERNACENYIISLEEEKKLSVKSGADEMIVL